MNTYIIDKKVYNFKIVFSEFIFLWTKLLFEWNLELCLRWEKSWYIELFAFDNILLVCDGIDGDCNAAVVIHGWIKLMIKIYFI